MDKRILAIIDNLSLWHGDVYKLAALVAAEQRAICEEEAAANGPVAE